MARRRDPQVVFEIDGDRSGSGNYDAAPAPEATPSWFAAHVSGPVRERWRSVPRRVRTAVVTGVAAVTVLGTGAVVVLDHRAEAAHAAHMVAQRGGVADLSVPRVEAWRVETDGDVMALLDGGLLVARSGTEVLAVDAATGEVAWRHDLGEAIECGPGQSLGPLGLVPAEQVVCLAGNPARTATVIAADGEVLGTRDLGEVATGYGSAEGSGEVATIVGDDAVAVGDRLGLRLDERDVEGVLAELDARRAAGTWHPVEVRVEDALTGEVRGEASLDVTTADHAVGCTNQDMSGSGDVWIYAEPYGLGDGVYLALCEQSVMLGTDGSILDRFRQPFRDGYVEDAGEGRTRYVAADGTETVIDGYLLESAATDGSDTPILAWSGDGALVASADGEVVWTVEDAPGQVLVTAAGTIVLDDESAVVGLDATTGERLWTFEDAEATSAYAAYSTSRSVTDGRVAVVVLPDGDGGSRLVALDLADGTVRWESVTDGESADLLAVDGNVVLVENGAQGWSIESGGDPVFADTALVGYAAP